LLLVFQCFRSSESENASVSAVEIRFVQVRWREYSDLPSGRNAGFMTQKRDAMRIPADTARSETPPDTLFDAFSKGSEGTRILGALWREAGAAQREPEYSPV
jgi:hypothetical protein